MKIEFDRKADAAYIYLKDKIKKGEVKKTISLDSDINIDMDKQGKILGIEILNASKCMPKPCLLLEEPIKTTVLD